MSPAKSACPDASTSLFSLTRFYLCALASSWKTPCGSGPLFSIGSPLFSENTGGGGPMIFDPRFRASVESQLPLETKTSHVQHHAQHDSQHRPATCHAGNPAF